LFPFALRSNKHVIRHIDTKSCIIIKFLLGQK
jgi:hypothetical protein